MKYNIYYLQKRTLLALIIIPCMVILFLLVQYLIPFIPQKYMLYTQYSKHKKDYYLSHQYLSLLTKELYTDSSRVYNNTLSQIQLLKKHIADYPTDSYNSKYLSLIATLYLDINIPLQAGYYFNKAISTSSNNTTPYIDFHILQSLAEIELDTRKKISYLEMLLTLYPQKTNLIHTHYTLGTLYDTLLDWDNAYTHYQKMLSATNLTQSSQINTIDVEKIYFRMARKKNNSPYSKKNRTWHTLEESRKVILNGLYSKSENYLKSLQAPGFFTAQWEESPISLNAHIDSFDMVPIIKRSNLRVSPTFQYLNEHEVLWPTYGWERLGTWYMVIRKIQQPDIITDNGKWEWAGIYFGETNKTYVPQ